MNQLPESNTLFPQDSFRYCSFKQTSILCAKSPLLCLPKFCMCFTFLTIYVTCALKFQIVSKVTLCRFTRICRRSERSCGLRLQDHTVKVSPNDIGLQTQY